MSSTIRLSIPEDLKPALLQLAADTESIGRNLEPSISELLKRVGEAADYSPARAAAALAEIMLLRAESLAVSAEERTEEIKL
jgi:hypothetical protein